MPLTIQRSYPTLTSLVANLSSLPNMNFQEIPFNGGRYNLKRCFALQVKCTQLFIIRKRAYSFSTERVWRVRYEFFIAEKIQLSTDKVPLVIKNTKLNINCNESTCNAKYGFSETSLPRKSRYCPEINVKSSRSAS